MTTNKVIYINRTVLYAMETVHSKDSIKVIKEIRLPIKEGIFANGMILDTPAFVSYLKSIKELDKSFAKDVIVVVDSSSIITKKIDVPEKIKGSMVHGIAKKELSYADELKVELVFDTCLISEETGTKAYCCALEKKSVKEYNEAFEQAGIRINRIDVPLSCILNLTSTLPEFSNQNFILNVIEDDILYSIIFERGNYIFSTRDRIYDTRGTEEFNSTIIHKIDSLINHFTQNSGEDPTTLQKVYFYGIPNDNIKEINSLLDYQYTKVLPLEINMIYDPKSRIDVSKVGITADAIRDVGYNTLPFYLFSCGEKVGVNLLESVDADSGTRLTPKQKILLIGMPSAALAVVLMVSLFFGVKIFMTNKAASELNAVMASQEYLNQYNAAIGTYKLSNSLSTKNTNLEKFDAEIACNKVRTDVIADMVKSINNTITINQIKYTTKDNSIYISGAAESELGPASFVKALKDLECFSSVEYKSRRVAKGYTFSLNMLIGEGRASLDDNNQWVWEGEKKKGDTVQSKDESAAPAPTEVVTATTGNIWKVTTPSGEMNVTSQEDVNYIRSIYPGTDFGTILEEGGFN